MKKIAFIGAGSVQFTTAIVKDLVTYPAFADAEICLMDTNPDHLEKIGQCVRKIKDEMHTGIRITKTASRAEALTGADGVLCTVFNGDVDVWRHEIIIPKKYGVDINVGDTRSVSGMFRALRNIPLMLEICADIQKYCPGAVFLNYTNPMSMLCKAMQTYTAVDVTGLCHSVQHTTRMLARWAGADPDRIRYTCLGVNHQAFITELTEDGRDLYPAIRERIADPEFNKKEKVRNEIFRTFGYYVTESSGHNSEYCAWFRKRPDLILKYCNADGAEGNYGEYAYSLNLRSDPERYDRQIREFLSQPVDPARGQEYAANIFNARFGDKTPFPFNANLLNRGTVENLPFDACVEIPVIADEHGYTRTFRGKMPDAPAALVAYTASIENLLVDACMEKSKEKVVQAVSLDPLCGAVLSLDEIRRMCAELFAVNRDYLGDYR